MAFWSDLVYWYEEATSDYHGPSLIDMLSQTDDRLRYCRNRGSFSSSVYIPEQLKHLYSLDVEDIFLFTFQVFLQLFCRWPSLFLQSCPTSFVAFVCECIIMLLKGNLQTRKKSSLGDISTGVSITLFKRNHFKASKRTRDVLASVKNLLFIKSSSLPSLLICSDMEQFILVPASAYNISLTTPWSTKEEILRYHAQNNPT